jgi:hypothetical protein
LIAKKGARNYTEQQADIQEADAAYLARVRDVYHDLARTERGWHTVACLEGGGLLPVDEVETRIWHIVERIDES